jgi:hypothetical protein
VEFAVNGNILTGTIPTTPAMTYTPSTSSATIVSAGTYVSGNISVAPIPNQRGESAITANGPTVTIPYGYYNPTGSSAYYITVTTASRAATTISASTNGSGDLVISANNNQATGYVTGSNKSASMILTTTVSGNIVNVKNVANNEILT